MSEYYYILYTQHVLFISYLAVACSSEKFAVSAFDAEVEAEAVVEVKQVVRKEVFANLHGTGDMYDCQFEHWTRCTCSYIRLIFLPKCPCVYSIEPEMICVRAFSHKERHSGSRERLQADSTLV